MVSKAKKPGSCQRKGANSRVGYQMYFEGYDLKRSPFRPRQQGGGQNATTKQSSQPNGFRLVFKTNQGGRSRYQRRVAIIGEAMRFAGDRFFHCLDTERID